jgi:hypothetical protein
MALAYYGMGVEGRASLHQDVTMAKDIAVIFGKAAKDAILNTSAAQKKEAILNGLKQVKGFFPITNVGPGDFNPLR